MDYSFVKSSELLPAFMAEVAQNKENTFALLDRMAVDSVPYECEENFLRFLGQVARQDWLDGMLAVNISPAGARKADLLLLVRLGLEAFELVKRVRVNASLSAFREVDKKDMHPLRLVRDEGVLVYEASGDFHVTPHPASPVRIISSRALDSAPPGSQAPKIEVLAYVFGLSLPE